MVFSSPVFIFYFLSIFLITYYLCVLYADIKIQNMCLLIFSVIFYAYGGFDFLFILIISIFINYIFAVLIDKYENHKKLFLIIIIIFDISMLFIFKYFNLFNSLFENFIKTFFDKEFKAFNIYIKLPIGISFYTFQIISYVIDVYNKKVKVNKSFFQVMLYALLFPQMIAGPIVRYKDIEKEINERHINTDKVYLGIKRFMTGFIKKIIFANLMGKVVFYTLDYKGFNAGFLLSILGIICYSIQIYLDFSAYSDMAIGIGKMIGFDFPENFNSPYISQSLTEIWKRWHMTLTSFFRDYVYIPLGGNKVSKGRHILNIIIVFALSSFWHGASFNFLYWGFYNALIMIMEKIFIEKILKKIPKILRILYADTVWAFGMLIFYFTDLQSFNKFIENMFKPAFLNTNSRILLKTVLTPSFLIAFLISVLLCTDFFKKIKKSSNNIILFDIITVIAFLYAIMEMMSAKYNPFIYFRF